MTDSLERILADVVEVAMVRQSRAEMRSKKMKSTNVLLFRAVALASLACALSPLVRGQGSTTTQGRGARTDPVQREIQRKFEMEIIENALRRSASRRAERYPPLVLEQIREDFMRLQVVDRKLMHSISISDKLDLELVARSAAEIKKRAARLKKNLALPELNAEAGQQANAEVQLGPERLRSLLSTLSSLIDQFVANPVFKESRLVDAQLSAKALQDIEGIIEVSDQVRRSSENLKAAAKSP